MGPPLVLYQTTPLFPHTGYNYGSRSAWRGVKNVGYREGRWKTVRGRRLRPSLVGLILLSLASCGALPTQHHINGRVLRLPATPAPRIQVKEPRLQSFSFVNSRLGYGFAPDRLLQTADGGRTWKQVVAGLGRPVVSRIEFVDLQRGWLWQADIAGGTTLKRTDDGGRLWHTLPGLPKGSQGFQFFNRSSGVLLCDQGKYPSTVAAVYRTADGGKTWHRAGAIPLGPGFDPGGAHLSFIDPRHGWIASGLSPSAGQEPKALFQTVDGGHSWRKIAWVGFPVQDNHLTEAGLPSGGYVAGLFFLTPRRGWLPLATGPVLETSNGGRSWQPVWTTRFDGDTLGDIQFVDPRHGWLMDRGDLWATVDGGKTWRRLVIGG